MISRPSRRKEFERNMNILQESFINNRATLNPSLLRIIEGLENVRLSPNKRVDLLSVNQIARLHANSIANFSMMKDKDL